jgi:hypothetical protein
VFPLPSNGTLPNDFPPLNKIVNQPVSTHNWKERIVSRFIIKKFNKRLAGKFKAETKDKGNTALILSLIALIGMIIPVFNLFSLPLAIIALIMGYRELKRNPGNKKAKSAAIIGWITIGLWIVVISIVLSVYIIPVN